MDTDSTTQVSAPGRFILFGEHAINFGQPAIALAVDYRMRCTAKLSTKFTVNGEAMEAGKHPHARAAVIHGWTDMDKPLALSLTSEIPEGLGLGDDAATTVACLGALSMVHDHIIFEHIAKNSFEATCEATEGAIPLDTSISTHGGALMLDTKPGNNTLWTFKKKDETWYVEDLDISGMNFILGYSGAPSPETEMAVKIRRFREKNSFARDIIKDMGKICREAYTALEKKDIEKVGELMNKNHRSLVNIGIGNPALEKLINAASRHSYGVKITGAGGGGCIVALAKESESVITAIENAGGKAFQLSLAKEGLKPDD